MKKHPFLSGFLQILAVLSVFPISAMAENDPFSEKVSLFFHLQKTVAQEKLYLHTDKPAYAAGETIFMKGYLVDAVTHSPEVPTNFICVELLDRSDSVLVRRKFKRQEGKFAGSIDIPLTSAPGDYYLRGYTEWMRNAPSDYFFSKPIEIGNAVVTDISSEIDYLTNEDGSRVMKIGFFDEAHKPYAGEKIAYTLTDKTGKVYRNRSTAANESGVIYIRLDKQMPTSADPRVDIVFDDDKFDYRRSFYIRGKESDFAVTFFPEGGNLLAGVPQIVAFKAQNDRGFGETVDGYVVNSRNDTVALFKTEHDGMGRFLLTAAANETYRAVARSSSGIEKSFALPVPNPAGIALSLNAGPEKIFYKILYGPGAPAGDTLHLLAHTRGEVIFLTDILPGKPSGAISSALFPDGIAHFLLCNTAGVPLSQRLAFFRKPSATGWTVVPDRETYGPRKPVTLSVTLRDSSGTPLKGDFSVSVTDAKSVRENPLADHIVSSLLLTSDLKGYIENPAYYLGEGSGVELHRDLLMLTHGWTRFKTDNLARLPRTDVNFFKEAGQFVSGHIENLFGGRAKRPIVIGAWWDGKDSTLRFANTTGDERGNFVVDNIIFRDTARFMIQGRTKGRSDAVGVVIDSIAYPAPSAKLYFRDDYKLLTDNYLEKVKEDYFNKGGIKTLSMKEIVVSANKLRDVARGVDSDIFGKNEFKKDNIHSLFHTLKAMPNVQYRPGNEEYFIYKGRKINTYIIDDFAVPVPFLRNVDISCVASIEFIKDPQMANFPGMDPKDIDRKNPVVYVRIQDRFRQLLKVSPGLTLFRILGYSDAKEFYNPVYETPEKKADDLPDLRTTLYWSPAPETDAEGTLHIRFYASDYPGDYRITVEGITEAGEPVHYSALFGK